MNDTALNELKELCQQHQARLVAVSKTKPIEEIQPFYDHGHQLFGENKVQELCEKQEAMPDDIEWHMIGHLQRNKVKYLAPFVSMVHAVDSPRLLKELSKQGQKHDRQIPCLLQLHIAQEETKFGFAEAELLSFLDTEALELPGVQIAGLMGMATNTDDADKVRSEFKGLRSLFDRLRQSHFSNDEAFKEVSMGMSGDYKLALEEGSTLIRVGSLLFGPRNYDK